MGLRVGLCAVLLSVSWGAHAQQRSPWGDFQQALLLESLDGHVDQARSIYRTLNRTLPSDHPVRGEALYALARTSVTLGEIEPARQILSEGIRTGVCKAHCRDLMDQIELRSYAVDEIPITWGFEDSNHSIFHPWRHDDLGSIRLEAPPGEDNSALLWTTTRGPSQPDRLVIQFQHPNPAPETIRFQVLSLDAPTWLRVEASDTEGHPYTWGSGTMMISDNENLTVTVDLSRMVRRDHRDLRLDPLKLNRIEIIDSSAIDGNHYGPNRLYIDDLEVF
jgi:hypothetical protein